jgi:geranylgeranyl pyrophosphate synthase
MAGPVDEYEAMLTQFCRHVGVGFQILNDLQDWQEHDSNKKRSGHDAEIARPTLLLALAADAASPEQRARLDEILSDATPPTVRASRLRSLYEELGLFEKARALVEKCRDRAEALADETNPDSLRQLLYFLTDTILSQDSTEPPPIHMVPLSLAPMAVSS